MKSEVKKKSVQFQSSSQTEVLQDEPRKVSYLAASQVRKLVVDAINECNSKIKLYTQNNPQIKRSDTAEGLINALAGLKFAIMHMNIGTYEDKQQNYYLAFNATIQIFDVCQMLRQSNFQSLTVDYLGFAICTLEAHLILINIKYLEWRVKLYIELAKTYEEVGSNEVALKTIELALKKVNELQNILELDPPLPNHTQRILENVNRSLRIIEIKYKVQLGQLPGDAFKKKLEDYFQNDREARASAIIECLRSKQFNYVEQQGKSLTWKEQAVKQSFELLKPDLNIITEYIKQILAEIDKEVSDDSTEEKRSKLYNEKINQVLILEQKMREASRAIPLEHHIELTFHAYDVNNMAIFEELSSMAFLRCKYRRVEVPYITDIKIVVSSHPNPNIPNGYERIEQDINEAQLKILLKKNRIFKEDKAQQQPNQSKDEKKDAKKGGKKEETKDVKKEETDQLKFQDVIPNVKHQYTYILVKRSMSPENAICGFKLILAPENNPNCQELKLLIEQGWRIIECPVQQYTGVRETNKLAVYICFKSSEESLKDEEEKKNLLLDIKPVFAKSPLARPDFGYEKVDIDLRQTPREFIKHPDNDYLYLTYKIEKEFFNNERELKLLMDLNELEKTFGKDKIANISDVRAQELDIFFDESKLQKLFQSIKESLVGPLGNQFYENRKEFLNLLCFFLWKKYMVNQLNQIDFIMDQVLQSEIDLNEIRQFNDHIQPLKKIYKLGLKMFNLILVRDPTRSIVWFIKCTLELTKILIQDDENLEASQFLKTCYDMVVLYRDEKMLRGLESQKDLFIPYSITANNSKIQSLLDKMMASYIDFKNELGCKSRQIQREKDLKGALSQEELMEELTEILNFRLLTKNDDNKDKEYFEQLPTENFISSMDLIINALQVDLITCYYRCKIKEGKRLEKEQKLTKKSKEFNSNSMTKKMSINQGKTFKETKEKLHTLQHDLQNAGRLSVPQPIIKDYEQNLKSHANKNPYLLSILNMLMAPNKKQFAEQKYLLKESLQQIKLCSQMETKLFENAVQDSVYICSSLLDDKVKQQHSHQFPPFDKLYNPEYIKETEQPRTPILIARSSSQIVVKLPPFNPRVNEMDYLNDPGVKEIRSMVLYGKVSAHGVNVSTTCVDLQNTGVRSNIGSVVQIGALVQNEGYCFAVCGFNINEKQSKKIGLTSDEVPLPINSLYAYLAKQAYWMGDYEVALQAARENINFFVEKSEIFDRGLDVESPIVFQRLRQQAMKEISTIEISQLAESLFINAKCLQRLDKKEKKIERDKQLCLQANLSLLALEASSVCQQIVLGKRILIDLYNYIEDIIKIKSKFLFQILIKSYIFLSEIPKQYWDHSLRKVSAKLIYEISVLCFQYNQINLGKLVIFQSTYLPNRKYKITPRVIEMAEEAANQAAKAAGQAQIKGAKKEVSQQQQEQKYGEDVKMISKVVYTLSENPSYQDYLEDSLLNFNDEYGDLVLGFIDNWKEQLDYYQQFVDNGTEFIEQMKSQLNLKWNFQEILKEPQTALQKLISSYKVNPNFIEMLCKFARKQIEQGNLKSAKEILAQAEQTTFDSFNTLLNVFQIRIESVENDIAWTPDRLEQLQSESETNGPIENKAIELFSKYFALIQTLKKDNYQTIWRAEFYYLKALTLYLERQVNVKESTADIYFEVERLDLEKINMNIREVKEMNTKNMTPEDIEFFKEIQKTIALAAFFSFECNSEFQLKNIIKFAQNIIIREQMNPFDLRNSTANIYSLLTGSFILCVLETKSPVKSHELLQNLTKEFWFNKVDIQVYADYCSYIINSILIEEKYSVLSEFCRHFCNTTQHYYSSIVIPFIIHAQSILEEKATQLTQEKKKFLDEKTNEYETWKNSKRRKNRAAMLTGEIPPEEVQYNHDKQIITNQINILTEKQNRITTKKAVAHNILSEIQRDANQAQLMLFECKRLLEKFGEDYKLVLHDTSQQQKKPHQLFGQTLIRKYKQVKEILRKRRDDQGLIRALSQMGDLYLAMGELSLAQENWNDALDTIFQKLHTLTHRNQVVIDHSERQCLQACVFLFKLAKYIYFANFNIYQECLLMAADLAFHIFKMSIVNPQTVIGIADIKTIQLSQDLFNENLDPMLTIQACDFILNGLIDNDLHLKALPFIQIMDYIACNICFSDYYSTKAKLYKVIVNSKIGMIKQAYHFLLQAQNEKCGPIALLSQNESIKLLKGINWFPNTKEYINFMPFFSEQNKEVIEQIQKLELQQNYDTRYSQLNTNLFQYARTVLLFEIHAQEIIDRPEQNDVRIILIKTLEVKLRELLVIIQKQDDQGGADYLQNGPLMEQESKEERLSLIYRCRNTLGQMNMALSQLTRAYFIFKNGITVIQNHIFGYQNAENGKEPENEEQQVFQTNAKDAKKPAKDVAKENKKGAQKGVKVEEAIEDKEVKFEYNWDKLSVQTKRKHLNGLWYIRFKCQIVSIYYQQNRHNQCLRLITKMKQELQLLNDVQSLRFLLEIEGRITIRQGKIEEGMALIQKCVEMPSLIDSQLAALYGDYGELHYERGNYEKAKELFQKSKEIFGQYKEDFRFRQIQNVNKKGETEKVKVNEKYMFPSDVMDQLQKKESKIRKDDKKGTKEQPGKKDAKNTKAQEIVEMKITPLNPVQSLDLLNVQKSLLKDFQNDPQQQLSIYVRFLEDYLRSSLRLAQCDLTLGFNQNVIDDLDQIENFIYSNFNLPQSFKLEFNYLLGLAHKRLFVQLVNEYRDIYINKYLNEKNKKYKKIHDRLPFRDIPRNKYLLDLPNFSSYLKEKLIEVHIEKSKKAFKTACTIIKGECIFFENRINIDQILIEMAELILLQREYLPRLEYKYIQHEEDERWKRMVYMETLEKLNLELEAFQILSFAMSVNNCKKEIQQTSLGTVNIPDPSKIPQELVNEILESDFNYKKKYDALLFDETKNKKTSVNTLDLVTLLNKMANESKLMTYSGNRCQKVIQKIHRFLKSYHNVYMQKCLLQSLDITSKADISVVFIEDGLLKLKSIYSHVQKEYKFIYILSRFNRSKLVSTLPQQEIEKLFQNEDKDVLYGNFYLSSKQLSDLELKCNNLKSKLIDSETKIHNIKERDFRRLNTDYLQIYDAIGKIFSQKTQNLQRKTIQEYDINTDRLFDFIPQLSVSNIDIFVKMFGNEGLEIENHNLVALFRNYHRVKYR